MCKNFTRQTALLVAVVSLLAALPCPARADNLQVQGKVVDLESGRPIGNFIIQHGHFEGDGPEKTFRFQQEGRSWPNPDGLLLVVFNQKGTLARVVAPGYMPHLILDEPYDGQAGKREVTIRMRPGWPVKGRLLDASKKPVAGASLFLVGGRMLGPNVTGGKAWHWSGAGRPVEDDAYTRAVTDRDGRFVLKHAGGFETGIAVSAPGLDFWLDRSVPRLGKTCEIVLPAPGRLIVRYDIEGDEPEATVAISFAAGARDAHNQRERKLSNHGRLVLDDLAPGRYQVVRQKTIKVGQVSRTAVVASVSATVESGNPVEVALAQSSGTTVEGEVIGLDRLKLPGALIYVLKPESMVLAMSAQNIDLAVQALTCDATGRFKTPRLAPGKYSIVAAGYRPGPGGQVQPYAPPDYRAFGSVTVAESGLAPRVRIEMPAPRDDGGGGGGAK
ncbi:MAG: MSCRAMM family protein [Isosphaeraceae bacterium]